MEHTSDTIKKTADDTFKLYEPFRLPEPEWNCWINEGLVISLGRDKQPPNWFHRKMQYLLLGFKWVKINNERL